MVAFTTVLAAIQALVLVIAVAVEAVVLYVGYGYLEERLGTRVIDTLENV